jgi:hypothetical protein
MKCIKRYLAALGILLGLGFVVVAYAQNVVTTTLVGTEYWNGAAGSVGGPGIVVPTYVLRNASNHQLVPTGTTVNTTVLSINDAVLATGAITTWNVTLPTAPYAGEKVLVNCPGGTVTTLSIAATLPSGVTLVGTNPTSCTSGGAIANGSMWQYSLAAKTWYRIE